MRYKKHLRTHITLVVIICFLFFSIILASLSVYYSFKLVRAESEEKLMNLVRTHAKKLDRDFVEKRILAEETRNFIQVTFDTGALEDNPNYMNEYEEEIIPFIYNMAEYYRTAWIFFNHELDGAGHDVWFYDENNDGIPERKEEQDASYYEDETYKDWFFVPKREKRPYWTNPYPTTILEDRSVYWISHAIPVYKNNTFIGVVGNDFLYSDFLKSFEEISVYGSGYGFLLNDTFQLLVHPDYNEIVGFDTIEEGRYQWVIDHMRDNETGILEYNWIDGDEKVLAYTYLDNGWILGITASKEIIYEGLFLQIRYMSMIIALGILMATWVMYRLSSRLTHRLENVTQIISETGNGDYDSPIPKHYTTDESEIGILARAVEVMRIKQKDSFKEIQSYSEGLERLVQERTEELEMSNQELEVSLEELKVTQQYLVESKKFEAINRFLIEIAHRMNTPLGNSAMTISYMDHILESIEQDVFTAEKQRVQEEINALKDSIKIASTGIRSSTEIIRGLQVLSKDLKEAMADTVNLKEIIEVCYREFKNKLKSGVEVGLVIKCPENLIIETYPVLFLEALNNLFKYSISYSMKGQNEKTIKIEVEQTQDLVLIIYQDKSILKYLEVKDRIFEPFSISSFETGIGGLELHMLFNLVNLGLKGKIECLQGEDEEPYFIIELGKKIT